METADPLLEDLSTLLNSWLGHDPFIYSVFRPIHRFRLPHNTTLSLRSALGDSGFFTLFVVLVFGNIVFIYRYVPETKGRTLEDMLRYFDEVTAGEGARWKSGASPA